jgi:hypothetical protein
VTVRDTTSLTCKDVVELVTELLGDALSPDERGRLEQHLLVCPPCTMHVGQVRAVIDWTAQLREESPSPSSPALLDQLRQWSKKQS